MFKVVSVAVAFFCKNVKNPRNPFWCVRSLDKMYHGACMQEDGEITLHSDQKYPCLKQHSIISSSAYSGKYQNLHHKLLLKISKVSISTQSLSLMLLHFYWRVSHYWLLFTYLDAPGVSHVSSDQNNHQTHQHVTISSEHWHRYFFRSALMHNT